MKGKTQSLALQSIARYSEWLRSKPILCRAGLTSVLLFSTAAANAQSVEFADDFSVNSIKYYTRTFFEGDNSGGISVENNGVRLIATSVGDGESSARFGVEERTNGFSISGSFDPETTGFSADDAWTQLSVSASLFNDITPEEREEGSELGDINMSVNSSVFANGSVNLFVCFGRNGVDGYEEYLLFENNSRHCKDYSTASLTVGTTFELGVSTTGGGTVNITAADQSDTIGLPGTLYPSTSYYRNMQVYTQGVGTGSYLLNSVTTDSGIDDFTVSSPTINRYTLGYGNDGLPPVIEAERVRVEYQSSEDAGGSGDLRFTTVTDYIEGTLELSSESVISAANSRVGAGIETIFANDTADGGFEGRAGDIHADLYLSVRNNGLRRAEFCLVRYDDDDNRSGLLDDGNEHCIKFPVLVELDTPYRMAIALDRAAQTITFRLNGFTHTKSLNTPLFAPAEPRAVIRISSANGGYVLGYIDDVRNSNSQLTTGEQAAGASAPTVFPPEPSAEDLQVESTLDAPYDYSGPISFVDDFSHGTTPFGLSRFPRETTNSAIGYFDGAIEIQSAPGDINLNNDPNTELRINSQGDEIRTVVSLSSRSRVVAGSGEASLDLRATLFNDSQDGGLNDREGDISANLRIQLSGDGRRRVTADLRRRNADGNNENLELFDGDNQYEFDLLPELDTPYELTIRLDREENKIVFSVGELMREVSLSTGVFQPAERDVSIAAWHRGDSGRSIIRIHSVSVGDFEQDFATEAPTIAPYYPAWNARYPGVSVEVIDERAKLEADGRITSGRNADITSQGISDYVGGLLELSSESEIAPDGVIIVGVAGVMYHETPPVDLNDRTGAVFAATRLTATGTGERFVQVCAWRSDDDSFGSSTDLITGRPGDGSNIECQRLETVPELDVAYSVSVSLDRDNATLTYTFADEVFTFNIGTDMNLPARQFAGVRARTSDDSKVVAYVDNLSFAAEPVQLAFSDNSLGRDISEFVNAGSNSANVSSSGGGSSSDGTGGGGGCSIGGSGSNSPIAIMALLSLFGLFLRRSKRKPMQ